MALKIRLSRAGAKKRPFYRIVVADSRSPRDGRFIERLGTYDPMLPKEVQRVTLKEDRIRYWIGVGAQPSDRVARFLGQADIIPIPEQKNNPQKAKPKAKAQARLDEEREKAKSLADDSDPAEPAKEEASDTQETGPVEPAEEEASDTQETGPAEPAKEEASDTQETGPVEPAKE